MGILISCVGVEPSEVPRSSKPPEPLEATPAQLSEMDEALQRREAFLQSERDSTVPLATAVLNMMAEKRQLPGLGMAVVEVNAGGLGLRIAAELRQGTHHVYLIDEPMLCSHVDPDEKKLFGTPDRERTDYLGAIRNVRDGPVRFGRHISEGRPRIRTVVGRPLVLVHAGDKSLVCGVFRETGEPAEDVLSSR